MHTHTGLDPSTLAALIAAANGGSAGVAGIGLPSQVGDPFMVHAFCCALLF